MKIEIDLPIPDDYEFVGYRQPRVNEYFFHEGQIFQSSLEFSSYHFIIRKKKPKVHIFVETGEVRASIPGEYYMHKESVILSCYGTISECKILKKITEEEYQNGISE